VFQCDTSQQRTHLVIGYVIPGTDDVSRARAFHDALPAD
jgi:hypothetical protein